MPLINVVQQLSFARDLTAVQEIVRRAARHLTGADGATFVLREGDECHYADEDAIAPLWKGARFPMRTCISGWAMLNREAAVIPDIYADDRIPASAYRPTFVKSLVVVPIRSLDPIGAIGNYWSTRHEATEEEIRSLQALADATALAMENVRVYAELEQRVRDRTRELEAAREAAQQALDSASRAQRAKSRFLAMASHDLRQPLQTLALLNGSLRRMVRDGEAQSALAQQELAVNTASRLVNALLDVSKLESGAIQPQIVDFPVCELFEELRQEFTSVAAEKGVSFLVEPCTGFLHGDPALLEQILRNLVSNAIKYTREGFVRLRCVRGDSTARIEVLDSGIGIAPDQLPHIFEDFYQVGVPSNRSRDGYGLGLGIVSRLVKLLDLELDARSEPGKGSAFSLEVPLGAVLGAQAPAREAQSPPRPRGPALSGRVLLVEDDKGVREATALLLRSAGYEVLAAASPSEALLKADEPRTIDLLVTDYHLDCAQTGLDVISALRGKLGERLKVILLSGDTSPRIKHLTLDDDMRLASKPIRAEHLLQLMTELTGDARELVYA